MRAKTFALVIEIKPSENKTEDFSFNNIMLLAILSGLSAVYKEVFLWPAKNHLAVWVVGNDDQLLIQAFLHHQPHFKKMQLLHGPRAEELFMGIVAGKQWNDCSTVAKLESLTQGFDLSKKLECLGPLLFPMVAGGQAFLSESFMICGSRNSWSFNDDKAKDENSYLSPRIQIKSKDLFYRFCVN
jgi:hypothetical protein